MRSVLLLFLMFGFCGAIDFCNITSCKGRRHIGCKNTMMFDHSCKRFTDLVDMTKFRRYLLVLHNKYRQDVASGKLEYLPEARNMPELVWDNYLAVLAEYHVKKCKKVLPGHPCVATDDFPNPKPNYADDFYPRPLIAESNVREITMLTEEWMYEVFDLEDSQANTAGSAIANILNDRSAYVGCAAGRDYDLWNIHYAVICYYSTGPPARGSLYKIGQFDAVACPYGQSPVYPNLCKTPALND